MPQTAVYGLFASVIKGFCHHADIPSEKDRNCRRVTTALSLECRGAAEKFAARGRRVARCGAYRRPERTNRAPRKQPAPEQMKSFYMPMRSARPLQTDISLLCGVGGAVACAFGVNAHRCRRSAALWPEPAAARWSFLYAKQDHADRRRPPGRDPGRGARRNPGRGLRLRDRDHAPAERQHLSRQGDAGRAVAAGGVRRVWRQPPRLPRLQRDPSRLLPDPAAPIANGCSRTSERERDQGRRARDRGARRRRAGRADRREPTRRRRGDERPARRAPACCAATRSRR